MTKIGDMNAQVSVVIPCYNAEKSIVRTIASVQAQGDAVGRVIVIDDGSVDGSLEALRPLADAGEITLITNPNMGGCHARNHGLAVVETDYVMFLDADDEIKGDILAGSAAVAGEVSADIVFSMMEIQCLGGQTSRQGPVGPPDQNECDIFANWFDGEWIGTCSVVWRTDFVRSIGGWDEALRVGQDGDLVLRALLAGARAARNEDGYGIYYRNNPGSVSLSGGVTEDKLAGQIDTIARVNAAARNKGWGGALGRNYAAIYFLARKSFMGGHIELGHRALDILRKAGHRGHHGTRSHVLLANLIGLERKVRWFGS